MQPSVVTTAPQSQTNMYWIRTIVAGLFLAGLAVLYFVIVLPVANAEVPISNFRNPFSFITIIYAIDLGILGIEYFYRLVKPPRTPMPQGTIGKSGVLGMCLRFAFMVTVGGSYLTGAMIATPSVFTSAFNSLPASIFGINQVAFAQYLHSLFATLIIGFGLAIVVFEIAKILAHKSTWKGWLVNARYPEIKVLYWLIAIIVIAQGILGLFLLGTISPVGPFPFLVGLNNYNFENLVRLLHGPLGALVFALFTNHIYYRIRPEFHIR